jgi:hypothetical protein
MKETRMAVGLKFLKIIILVCLWVSPGRAHDKPTDWIGQERRTNAAGVLCCGKGDCHPFTVDQVKVMPDGYHFPDGEVTPFNKVAPSIDNLYWSCRWGGETKCVFAPLGAS